MGSCEVYILIMIYIGIVGSSKVGWDINNHNTIKVIESIHTILDRYDNQDTTIVSGGAHGVDSLAVIVARFRKYNIIEYKPNEYNWNGYKKRNLLIANKCDKVYSIALPIISNGIRCYHCAKVDRDDNHYKTAGCWTAQRCNEFEVVIA